MNAEPAQVGHLAPIGRTGLVVGLEQGAGGLERLVGGEDTPHGGGQLLVLVGDGYRHRCWPPWRRLCSDFEPAARTDPARLDGAARGTPLVRQ